MEASAIRREDARERHTRASSVLMGAAVLYLLALLISYVLLRYLVESAAGRDVTWGEIFSVADRVGLLSVLLIGTLFQVGLAVFCGVASHVVRSGYLLTSDGHDLEIFLIVAGVFGIIISIVIVGGFLGVLAGALTIAGGALSLPRAFPRGWTVPPSNY